jgi:magnesium chelatase family protein
MKGVLEVPVFLSFLIQSKQLDYTPQKTDLFLGELSLDGSSNNMSLDSRFLESAIAHGFKNVFIPKQNLSALVSFRGLNFIAYSSAQDLIKKITQFDYSIPPEPANQTESCGFDGVVNNYFAKKILTIGVGTFSNVLVVGEPGIGKTMLLNAISNILPQPSNFYKRQIRTDMSRHPFISLDSSVSKSDLTRPVEGLSLYEKAHMGVMGVNEVNQLSKKVLELLKSALDEKKIWEKGQSKTSLHSFIATMNPCKCGYANSQSFKCVCNDYSKKQYIHKLGLPFLDRFDLFVDFNASDNPEAVSSSTESETETAQSQIKALFSYQEKNQKFICQMDYHSLLLRLSEKARLLFEFTSQKLHLSMRRQVKLLRVAFSISVLKGHESISPESVYEAITYQKFYYDLLQKEDTG